MKPATILECSDKGYASKTRKSCLQSYVSDFKKQERLRFLNAKRKNFSAQVSLWNFC